jgi:peroxiredoxin
LQRGAAFAVILGVVIVVAYFGGIKAAQGLQVWKAKRERVKQTEAVLEKMGTGLGVGKSLPDDVLADLEGVDIRLSDLLCDQTVVVYFRTDCSFSQAELKALMQATGVPVEKCCFVLISNSEQTELWEIRQRLNISCPILFDRDGQYGKRLGIFVVPMNFIVDAGLIIKDVVSGPLLEDEIGNLLE